MTWYKNLIYKSTLSIYIHYTHMQGKFSLEQMYIFAEFGIYASMFLSNKCLQTSL